jgi:phage major head subunit gpT-like protein
MAHNIFANITARGTLNAFREALANIPTVWDKHVQTITSSAADEQHVWMGNLPEPRELLDSRSFVAIRDFTYTVANNEYELSFIIDQNSMEDDQHGITNRRIAEAAQVWATYKDSLFATLLINGETSTETFDSTTFHDDTRTIGDSGTIDNSLTADITTVNAPTAAEMLTTLKEARETMWRYADDTGRTAYNATAMSTVRAVGAPEHEKALMEAVQSTLVGGGDSNPWANNLVEIDILPYLTDADNAIYFNAVGDSNRMPFIYQSRVPLQVQVLNGANDVAENHGVKVLARERFRLAYGEPRRSIRYDFT